MTRRVLCLLLVCGCVRIDRTSRVERGALLRTFTRESVPGTQLETQVAVAWPSLNISLTRVDTCRRETVEEYAEERITESSSPAAGATLATGATATLAAAALFGVSFVVSAAPDTTVIDAAGRYGPSLRQQLQLTSGIAAGIGLPALVAGVIAALRSGVATEVRRVEQVASAADRRCHEAGVTGQVQLRRKNEGVTATKPLVDSQVRFAPFEVATAVTEIMFDGQPLKLDETVQRTLDAYSACLNLESEKTELAAMTPTHVERLALCQEVRPELASKVTEASEALERRQATGALDAFPIASKARTFEEAMAATRPALTLAADRDEVSQLDEPARLQGQAAVVRGVLEGALAPNIGVLRIGTRSLFLFVPVQKTWGGDFAAGSRVEAVVVLTGTQTVGERTLPLARVVWLRPAF
jgi:hypothetical protein